MTSEPMWVPTALLKLFARQSTSEAIVSSSTVSGASPAMPVAWCSTPHGVWQDGTIRLAIAAFPSLSWKAFARATLEGMPQKTTLSCCTAKCLLSLSLSRLAFPPFDGLMTEVRREDQLWWWQADLATVTFLNKQVIPPLRQRARAHEAGKIPQTSILDDTVTSRRQRDFPVSRRGGSYYKDRRINKAGTKPTAEEALSNTDT